MKRDTGGQGSKGKTRRHGPHAFEAYYSGYFGDRWQQLRPALLDHPAAVALDTSADRPYYLDRASYEVALTLARVPGERILDMCAAPGGKTLVLALYSTDFTRFVANERSATRRARLHRVLDEHLPPEVRDRVEVSAHDASRWGLYERGAYDKILVDVPCSSERHVINDTSALENWSAGRSRRLAAAAVGFLAAAVDAAAPGGVICYSTCALTDAENDEVVARVLGRRAGISVLTGSQEAGASGPAAPPGASPGYPTVGRLAIGEATEFGLMVLPDAEKGAGPLYAAFIKKG